MAILDFYLDPGEPTGASIAAEIKADIVIGFSSVPSASYSIVEAALNRHASQYPVSHACIAPKLRHAQFNDTLIEIFAEFL